MSKIYTTEEIERAREILKWSEEQQQKTATLDMLKDKLIKRFGQDVQVTETREGAFMLKRAGSRNPELEFHLEQDCQGDWEVSLDAPDAWSDSSFNYINAHEDPAVAVDLTLNEVKEEAYAAEKTIVSYCDELRLWI